MPEAENNMKIIAYIHTEFTSKFGIPRQSGIIKSTKAEIVFEAPYRNPDALRGLEGFSHLWLIWKFSETTRDSWSPTVRPPRLGGSKRMGVFATRSPFRPNPIGLSSVKLESLKLQSDRGPIIYVSGADLMDQTPIFDIKPYLAYTDSHPDAAGGFTDSTRYNELEVFFPDEWIALIPEEKRESLLEVLANDPRPHYQNDSDRIYGFEFANWNIKFKVENSKITVCKVSVI